MSVFSKIVSGRRSLVPDVAAPDAVLGVAFPSEEAGLVRARVVQDR